MAEDESKKKKQIKNENKTMEMKRSDENLKIKRVGSDTDKFEKGSRMKKSSSRDVQNITRRKSKTRKLTPIKNLDLSKRLQNSFRKTNDTKIRLLYHRAKNKVQNKNENPEEVVKILDVPEEYDAIATEPETMFCEGPINNENNGNLFINGVPFWSLKDEKPPNSGTLQVSDALKELLEKKLTLVKEIPKPQDLDKYHELPTMISRDKEYFETTNRILSNTIRALVVTNGNVKKSHNNGPIKPSNIGFQIPDVVYIYNRKNRIEEMKTVKFTQGTFVKKKKSILANFLDYIY